MSEKTSTHTVLKCLTDGCKKVSLRVELNITISSSYWDYTIKGDFSKFRKFANSCAQGHTDKYMYEWMHTNTFLTQSQLKVLAVTQMFNLIWFAASVLMFFQGVFNDTHFIPLYPLFVKSLSLWVPVTLTPVFFSGGHWSFVLWGLLV